jgi:hypothetical protein
MIQPNNTNFIGRIPLFTALISLLSMFLYTSQPAHALPGAPQATECQSGVGGRLFSNGGDVEVEIIPANAGFTIELSLVSPIPQRFIATNRDTGTIVKLGSFPAGVELIFGVFVRETQKSFLMGPGSVNPDGLPHAEVICFGPKRANIGFEDQVGGGDQDYNDMTFTVRQTQSCNYSISPPSQSFGAGGGRGTVSLNTSSGCSWSVTSDVNWVTVTSGSAGSDGGTVNYSVAVNTSSDSRTGRIMLQAESFTVFQDAAGSAPLVTSAVRNGKKLFVYGINFDSSSVILLNGEQQKTLHDDENPSTIVIGKKAGKWVQPGDKLRVRSSSGALSPEYSYTP